MSAGKHNASETWFAPLMPSEDQADPTDVGNGAVFGPFEPGEHVTVICNDGFRVIASRRSSLLSSLSTRGHPLPAGAWRMALPRIASGDGGVYVHLVSDNTGMYGSVTRTFDAAGTVR